NHTTNVAFQGNVVQFPLGRFRFTGVFLGRITHFVDFLLAVKSVAVYANLGVQAVQITGRGNHQRVDLNQGQIALFEQFGKAHEDLGELADLLAFQAQFKSQLAALVRLSAYQRIDFRFQDFFWSLFSNLLDLNADFGSRDRKSTRLNSSYVKISYAVFCLKKKMDGR